MKPDGHPKPPFRRTALLAPMTMILAWLAGCGGENRDLESYSGSRSAVVLQNPEQHMGGYGRKECLVCHNTALNVHRDKGTPINVDALNEAIRNNGEAQFCLGCHGTNGN